MGAYLNTMEAAKLLRVSKRSLEKWRSSGGGPEFLKIGRLVFYEEAALADWRKSRARRSTSDPGPGRR